MDAMRAMSRTPTHLPSSRTRPCPFLNGQKLSPSLVDPLLALECMVFGVNPDVGVVLEELQVPRGEVRLRECFVESCS
jgi:hypothetical protein